MGVFRAHAGDAGPGHGRGHAPSPSGRAGGRDSPTGRRAGSPAREYAPPLPGGGDRHGGAGGRGPAARGGGDGNGSR